MDISVTDAPDASRYEARADGEVAGVIDYTRDGDVLDMTHTEVRPEHQGQGTASTLVRGALDDVRRRGLRITPSCSYVRSWIGKHPDYADVVAGG